MTCQWLNTLSIRYSEHTFWIIVILRNLLRITFITFITMVIKTFVFIDFEATGLPEVENNRTKATELTLLAVSRCDIMNANSKNLPPWKKLTFRCNPQRKITTEAAILTGLTNNILSNEPIFKDKIKSLNEFLDLPEQVCLVAHSGDKFDFRLLRAEYNDAGARLPIKLLCLDSFKVFKAIAQRDTISVGSLALKNLYKTFVKKNPSRECHTSEYDCLMLLECVIAKKDIFLEYAEVMSRRIYSVSPLR